MRQRALIVACAAAVVWFAADTLLPRGLPLGIVLLGATFGSLTALVAVGIVLLYRAQRLVNFAQAELGAVAAVVAIGFSATHGWGFLPALLSSVALAVAMGAGLEWSVIRRFARAPRLIAGVATIGLAQVLGGAAILLPRLFPEIGGTSGSLFSTGLDLHFSLHPVVFNGDHIVALVTLPAVLIALTMLRRTRVGIATEAVSEDAERAQLCGVPVKLIGTIVWAVAGGLSAVAIIVRVPVLELTSLDTITGGGPSLLLRALGAAVVSRMRSVTQAAIAAVGIGVAGELAAWTFSNTTYADALTVVVILIALIVRSRRVENARERITSSWRELCEVRPIPSELRRLPEVRIGATLARVVPLGVALVVPLVLRPSQEQLGALVFVYAILAVSLAVLTGWAGQISLGHFALAGIGGATTSVLLGRHGWDLLFALAAGVLAAAAASILIGLPALRAQGSYLAVTTLGFAIVASSLLLEERHLPWFVQMQLERPVLLGRFPIHLDWQMYYLCLAVLLLVIIGARNLRRAHPGRALIASRDNEQAAQAAGVDTLRIKLWGFALSGGIAGLAGGLYVLHQYGLKTDSYSAAASIRVFSMAVIGGLGSIPGAVLGAVYVRGAEYFLTGGWSLLATGAGLLVLLVVLPDGLGGALYRLRDAALRAVARRRAMHVPGLVAVVTNGELPAQSATVAVAASTDVLLRCRDLDVSYEGFRVLHGVDLDVARGEILAVLGTNGAGKSTLLRAISGLSEVSRGTVSFDGTPSQIGHSPGGRGVFGGLTVDENLRVASWAHRGADVDQLFELFPVLREHRSDAAGTLSGGQQQMLSLAMAFLGRPKLLLIDELSLGLAPVIVDRLVDVVRELNAQGTTVVLVEQSVQTALKVADRAVFLEKGRVRFSGAVKDLAKRPDLIRSVYLTDMPKTRARRTARTSRPVVLQVERLTKRYGGVTAAADVWLDLHDGEILGIIGPNGAGKTTLLDMVSGFVQPDSGCVFAGATDVTNMHPVARAALGLGRTFQDSRLFPSMIVRDAIAVALDRHVQIRAMFPALFPIPSVIASEAEVMRRVDEVIERFNLTPYRDLFISELSTGSRRLVEIASAAAVQQSILVCDEPSAGLAGPEAEALGPLLRGLRDQTGCALLVVEHHIPLITQIADRLVALDNGRVIAEGPPAKVLGDKAVVASYLGSAARGSRATKRVMRTRPLRPQIKPATNGHRPCKKQIKGGQR